MPFIKGKKHTEETKRKISLALSGDKNPRYGKKGKDNPRYGVKHTEESKRKMRESLKGRIQWNKGKTCPQCARKGKNNGMYGKKHSEETITKLRVARLNQVFPKKDTSIEAIMQEALARRGVIFEKQVPLLGKYQADIKIENLIIECDGDYWHNFPNGTEGDHIRDIDLKEAGYDVLRFWGNEIRDDVSRCVDEVEALL